jgi:hypothetical protein
MSLVKRDENFTVYEYSNGYMIECSGRDGNDDWITEKTIFSNWDDAVVHMQHLLTLPRD